LRVASNSGPLIHLAQIRELSLLKELFGEVLITDAVKGEVVKEKEHSDVVLIENAIQEGWIRVVKSSGGRRFSRFGIHDAEASLISYAIKENIGVILLDDDAARELARTLDLKVRGSIGVVIESLKKGKISKVRALKILDELNRIMYLSSEVYKIARDTIEGEGQVE
jgi:hypothetical protein